MLSKRDPLSYEAAGVRLPVASDEKFHSLQRDRGQTLLPSPYLCRHFDTGVDRVATQQRHVENLLASNHNDTKKSNGRNTVRGWTGKGKDARTASIFAFYSALPLLSILHFQPCRPPRLYALRARSGRVRWTIVQNWTIHTHKFCKQLNSRQFFHNTS